MVREFILVNGIWNAVPPWIRHEKNPPEVEQRVYP